MFRGLFLLLIFLGAFSCSPKADVEYSVRFGYLITENEETFSFLNEATIVPLITMSSGMFYGVEINPNHDFEYQISIIVISPDGGEDRLGEYTAKGIKVVPMGFDGTDTEGIYLLNVIIDGTLVKRVRFNAQKF